MTAVQVYTVGKEEIVLNCSPCLEKFFAIFIKFKMSSANSFSLKE